MELFAQQVMNGLVLGSVYSLVALGVTLIYGTMEIPNFAHGHLYMLGAYVTFAAVTGLDVHYWIGMVLAVAALAVVGILVERLAFRPLRHAPHVNMMIAAVGLMLFLEAFAQLVWGADFRRLPSPYGAVVDLWGTTVTEQKLILIVAGMGLMAVLFLFLKRTALGAAIEAVSQDRVGAQLVGIDPERISMITFALSAGLAAAAAALIAPINLISPSMGLVVGLKAFVIVVIGGMGSVAGAIVCGYGLALAESLGGTYLATDYQDLIAFAILALVLTVRPSGLFAKGA